MIFPEAAEKRNVPTLFRFRICLKPICIHGSCILILKGHAPQSGRSFDSHLYTQRLRCKQRKGLLSFYQFDVEVQFLASHFMVGIEGNGRIIAGSHLDGHRLTGGGIQDNILADVQRFTAG